MQADIETIYLEMRTDGLTKRLTIKHDTFTHTVIISKYPEVKFTNNSLTNKPLYN